MARMPSLASEFMSDQLLLPHGDHPLMFQNLYAAGRDSYRSTASRLSAKPSFVKKVVHGRDTVSSLEDLDTGRDESDDIVGIRIGGYSGKPKAPPHRATQSKGRCTQRGLVAACMSCRVVCGVAGQHWEELVSCLFKGLASGSTHRRTRRVQLLCALQTFYDSSGISAQHDPKTVIAEVQGILDALNAITIPKNIAV